MRNEVYLVNLPVEPECEVSRVSLRLRSLLDFRFDELEPRRSDFPELRADKRDLSDLEVRHLVEVERGAALEILQVKLSADWLNVAHVIHIEDFKVVVVVVQPHFEGTPSDHVRKCCGVQIGKQQQGAQDNRQNAN